MPKDLRTFMADMQRRKPDEYVSVTARVNPARYDVTAIIKHLDAQRKFPVLVFENCLSVKGERSPVRLMMNAEITQSKIQVALGVSDETDRVALAEECLRREDNRMKPVVVPTTQAPVKELVQQGEEANLLDLPIMRHHYMDGGPYMVMASTVRDRATGVYNCSYHRMEVKGPRTSTWYASPRHNWQVFRDHEQAGIPCPLIVVMGHHPAYNMGAAYKGAFEVDEYDVIGGYMGEPLRLTPSATWGDQFLIPADAELVIEGHLLPDQRLVDGPFGEAPGYLGPQRASNAAHFEVTAINRRRDAIIQSIITPEGDKPWLDLPREAAYLRRVREAVPSVKAVCKGGRHSHYAIYISMNKTSEGDPGRAAAAALTFDHTKMVFVFDADINIYDPTEILWGLATRVQPHKQIAIMPDLFRGNMLDPSMQHDIRTSVMIVDATRPLDRPFSPVSKCPDDAMSRVKLADYIDRETLGRLPTDRTSYWC